MVNKIVKETGLVLLAVVLSVVVAFLTVLYAKLIRFLAGNIYLNLPAVYRWLIIFTPAGGGLVVGLFIKYGSLTARGHGIPALLETIKGKEKRLSARDLLVEGFASAITIGTGGSAGRIGPVVEIGAGIGDLVGYNLKLPLDLYQTMLGCGAAAAVSGIFMAPLAGVLFVIEVLFKEIKLRRLGLIIISSITSYLFVRNFTAYSSIFTSLKFSNNSFIEMPLFLLLGLCGGIVSYLFIYTYYNITLWCEKIKVPYWVKPAAGGFIVGLIGYFSPRILGTGLPLITEVFTEKYSIVFLALLVILKIFATSITLGSGGSGGIFAPALTIGALTGTGYEQLLVWLNPGPEITSGIYGLAGMAAVLSGLIRAPLTSTLIIFEITGNYALIIPVLSAAVISFFLARIMIPDSIYSPVLFKRL